MLTAFNGQLPNDPIIPESQWGGEKSRWPERYQIADLDDGAVQLWPISDGVFAHGMRQFSSERAARHWAKKHEKEIE